MAIQLVETVSIFRMRYAIETDSAEYAADEVTMGDVSDMSQQHIAENITSIREISEEEYIRIFDEDNDYLASWTDEQKFESIKKLK